MIRRCAQTQSPYVYSAEVSDCANDANVCPRSSLFKKQETKWKKFYISTRIVDPKPSNQEVLVMRLGLNDV